MKQSIFTVIFALLSVASFGQDFVVNAGTLTDETQKSSDDDDRMSLIWWIPTEFWEASMGPGSEDMSEVIAVLDQYTVFAMVDGEIGAFGSVHYVSVEELKNGLTITDNNGDVFKPLKEKAISQETSMFLQLMRPIFTNMLGAMGENMHFILFPKENLEGKRLLDPYIPGTFTVAVRGESFVWETPLGSLFAPRTCQIDGKKWNGTWTYCPVHGEKLIDTE